MSRAYDFFGFKRRINILKKVKVDGSWKFCPAVVEPSGKLKDKVKVKGRTETHVEGVYYLEWRENGRRMRESVHNRSEVLKRARMKAFQLDPEGEDDRERRLTLPVSRSKVLAAPATHLVSAGDLPTNSAQPSAIAHLIFQAVESYIQEVARTAVAAKTNLPTVDTSIQQVPQSQANTGEPCAQVATHSARGTGGESHNKKVLIVGAIESYLRDIEPPQREPKTYKSYRSTLHLFRDTCKKKYLNTSTARIASHL